MLLLYNKHKNIEKAKNPQRVTETLCLAHLPDDVEAGVVERGRAPSVSEAALKDFFSQLPLSRCLVVGLVNLMPMALKQK